MPNHKNNKKKLIISHKNLSDSLKELFKQTYPEGYRDYLQKTIKPNGEPIFVVPLETYDTSYMVKFDVKIDTALVDDDLDKDIYGEENREENSEFAPLSEAVDKEEGNDNSVGTLKHGSYDEMFDGLPEDKKEFEMANEDIEDSFGNLSDDDDENNDDDESNNEEDREPDDSEVFDIEALLNEADAGVGLLRDEDAIEENRKGKSKKKASDSAKTAGAVKQSLGETKSSTGRKRTSSKTPTAESEPTATKNTKAKSPRANSAKAAGIAVAAKETKKTDSEKPKAETKTVAKVSKKAATDNKETKTTAKKSRTTKAK